MYVRTYVRRNIIQMMFYNNFSSLATHRIYMGKENDLPTSIRGGREIPMRLAGHFPTGWCPIASFIGRHIYIYILSGGYTLW
jgi:hypothetical protein